MLTTLNQRERWGLIALAMLLVVALGTILLQALREPETVYQDKPISAWVRSAVIRDDGTANWYLHEARRTADPVSKARIDKEIVHSAMKFLNTKDNPLWKPYTFVRTNLPPSVARVMPTWQEPASVRSGAVWMLFFGGPGLSSDPAPPGLCERATPVLCNLARNDPDKVLRKMATLTLSQVGTFSPEAFQIMVRALNSTDFEEVEAGARWFAGYPLEPGRVVPLLILDSGLRGLAR